MYTKFSMYTRLEYSSMTTALCSLQLLGSNHLLASASPRIIPVLLQSTSNILQKIENKYYCYYLRHGLTLSLRLEYSRTILAHCDLCLPG
ncbi:hypothetical protein AAY473_005514 [Plecturocebus cupreus]